VLQSLPEPLRSQLLNGDFRASAAPNPFQIIPTEWVRAAQKRWIEREKPETPLTAVGIDPSRGGRDKTALSKRYDNWFDYVKTWEGVIVKDGAIMAEYARQEIGDAEPNYINIDVSGIGSSAYDHLKTMYGSVNPFNPAEGSEYRDKSQKLKMRNKRGKLTPAESSIVLDLRPILVARNITNPLTFLLKMGIVNNSAIKILKGEAVQINFNQLTKLCVNLNCTPNDLFALRQMTLPINHQLHQINWY
jgi:DNA-binding Xre family transcriptional regulator